jgi:hypothetical protein
MGLATQKAKGPGAINEAEFNARKKQNCSNSKPAV